jgi:O-antigen/teichoic acid export membrane protein
MIKWNAFSQMAALGVVLVVQTLYMIVVARVLGPEDFGRFSLVWVIVQILLIGGDLGLHNSALRRISQHPADSERISGTLLWLKIRLSAILFLIVLLLALPLPESASTKWALVIFGAGMFFHSLGLGLNIVFQAHGKLYLASLNIVLLFSVQGLCGLLFLWMGGRVPALGAAYLLAGLAALAFNLAIFQSRIHPISLRPEPTWRAFARESLPVGFGTLFSTVSGRIGVALLAFLSGPFDAGIFSAAQRIVLATHNVPIGIFSAVLPALAIHQGGGSEFYRLFQKSLRWMTLLSLPLAILFFAFASPLIFFVYSTEYAFSIPVLKVLSWSLIPVFCGMAFSHVILSQHHLVRLLPWVTGLALIVNLAACLVWIPRWQAEGAAWAVLLSETVLAVGYFAAARSVLLRHP